jgi:hypothetical protein
MAAKPKATRRRSTPRAVKPAGVLDKHSSALKLFANYGFAGLAFGYLLIVTVPEGQKAFQAALEKQAEQSREDRKAALAHGERAVERIATSIDGVKGACGSVQAVTQGKQSQIIDRIEKTNQILESHKTGAPVPPVPME